MSNQQDITKRQQQALDRSLALKLCDKVDGDGKTFIVDSTSQRGVFYHVRFYREGAAACSCAAGQQGWPCVHVAACWRVKHDLQTARITLKEPVPDLPEG